MKAYRSKNKLNTDKQFVFTANVDPYNGFWFALGIHNAEINNFSDIDSVISAKMRGTIIIDNSNQLVKLDHYTYGDDGAIKSNEELQNNTEFDFLDKKCIWLNGEMIDKTQYPDGKFYEKITEFNGETDTYTNESGNTYKAAPADKYSKNENYPQIDTAKYPIISVFSFENNVNKTKKYIDNTDLYKIKLTITKNAIVSLYLNGEKISDFKFNYSDKNDNYLYIICGDEDENQNVLSNSAVSFVESNETS